MGNIIKENWEDYFKKLPIKLPSESDVDYKNRCYTWSRDNFNPPITMLHINGLGKLVHIDGHDNQTHIDGLTAENCWYYL